MQHSYGIIPVYLKGTEPLFLLVQHAAGHWGFPKGRAEPGETPRQTATRELLEETGISDIRVVPNMSFVERYTFPDNGTLVEKQVTYFLGEVGTNSVTIQQDEIQAYAWVNYTEGQTLITFPEAKAVLRKAYQQAQGLDIKRR